MISKYNNSHIRLWKCQTVFFPFFVSIKWIRGLENYLTSIVFLNSFLNVKCLGIVGGTKQIIKNIFKPCIEMLR